MSNKKLSIDPSDWEMSWGDPFGVQSSAIRPQCEEYEYQFEVGELVKLAHGFHQEKIKPGDVGVVMKRVVMYSSQVKSDGPAYKIAWQKNGTGPLHMREYMLVPAKRRQK